METVKNTENRQDFLLASLDLVVRCKMAHTASFKKRLQLLVKNPGCRFDGVNEFKAHVYVKARKLGFLLWPSSQRREVGSSALLSLLHL